MQNSRFVSVPVLIGGTIITVVVLTWGTTKLGISSVLVLLFAIPFVFPAALFHKRRVYALVMAIFFLTALSMEWYFVRGLNFIVSSYVYWVMLVISAEVILQISGQRRRADEISNRRALELQAMDSTMAELSNDLSIEHFLQEIVERASKLLKASLCELALFDAEQGNLEIVASFPFNRTQVGFRMKMGEGSMGRVAVIRQPAIVNNYKSWANAMPTDISTGVEAVLDVPLLKGNELIGVLGVGRYNKYDPFTEDDKFLLSVFGRQATIAIQNARLYKEIQTLAFTDALTGINNRRRLFELAEKEFLRAQRYNRPLSFILLDIDHFKSINDHYGHAVGDVVLRWFAQECSRSIRDDIDIIGRFGGEEFAIFLPETNIGIATLVAHRLHERISNATITAFEYELKITCSMGLSTMTNELGLTLDHLIDRADQALYKAKETRNTIAWWNDELEKTGILKKDQ